MFPDTAAETRGKKIKIVQTILSVKYNVSLKMLESEGF